MFYCYCLPAPSQFLELSSFYCTALLSPSSVLCLNLIRFLMSTFFSLHWLVGWLVAWFEPLSSLCLLFSYFHLFYFPFTFPRSPLSYLNVGFFLFLLSPITSCSLLFPLPPPSPVVRQTSQSFSPAAAEGGKNILLFFGVVGGDTAHPLSLTSSLLQGFKYSPGGEIMTTSTTVPRT